MTSTSAFRRPMRRPKKSRRHIFAKSNDGDESVFADFEEPIDKIFIAKAEAKPRKKSKTVAVKKETSWQVTAVFTLMFFLCSRIPLWTQAQTESTQMDSSMTFSRRNTWMSVGTQPFVLVSMLCQLMGPADTVPSRRQQLVGGLIASLCQAYMSASGIISFLQLIAVSVALMQSMDYVEKHGKMSLSTALIVTHGCMQIVRSTPYQLTMTFLCVGALIFLEECSLAVRLSHKTQRINTSAKIKLMYNGTTPLILVYTVLEWITHVTRGLGIDTYDIYGLVIFPSVYYLTQNWPEISQRTGFHVIKDYGKQGYTMPGWRSEKAMGSYFQSRVVKMTNYNAIALCAMAALSMFFQPSVSCGTLLIIVQALTSQVMPESKESQHQLHEMLRRGRRLIL